MSKRIAVYLIGIAAVLVAVWWFGRSETRDGRAFTEADSWYAPAGSSDSVYLERDRFAPVVDPLQPEAQAALSEVPVKRITAEDAARFAGQPLPSGAVYVLLRGVVLNEGTGSFSVRVNGSTVEVNHGCMGRGPASMKRKAVVAVVPTVPERVFVSCCMAE